MEEMVMDAKEIQSDLYSLKTLYGLVKSGSSNTESAPLDGRSRFLLKNLLDNATNWVLKSVAGQGEAPDTGAPAEQQQPADLSTEQQHIPSQDLLITEDYSGSVQKGLCSETERKFDRSGGPLWKERSFVPQLNQDSNIVHPAQNVLTSGHEYRRRCRVCQRNTIKHLETKEGIQSYGSNNFSNQFVWNNRNETESQKGVGPFERNSNGTEQRCFQSDRIATDFAKACCSDNEAVMESQEVDFLSKDASKAIEQIESSISAFHLGSDPVHLFVGRSAQQQNCALKTKSECPAPQIHYGAGPNLNLSKNDERYMKRNTWQYNVSSQRIEESTGQTLHQAPCVAISEEIHDPPYLSKGQTFNLFQPARAMCEQSTRCNLIRTRGPGWRTEMGELVGDQDVKAIIDEIKTRNRMMGHNDLVSSQIYDVPNFTIPVNLNETSYTSRKYPASTSGMRNLYQSHTRVEDDSHGYRLFPTYRPTDSTCLNENEDILFVDPNLNVSSTSGVRCRTCPSEVISAQCQGFHKHQQDTGQLYKDGMSRNRKYMTQSKAVLPYRESEFTTDSYASPSQQTSSLNSASENGENSLPDNSRDTEYVTSRTCSETGTGSLYTSYTVDSEDPGYYSSTCDGASHEASSSSCSVSVECSSQDQSINRSTGSRHKSVWTVSKRSGRGSGRGWTHRSSNLKNNRKQRGVWKRIKDKLAVIFHQHHHHHHHHHDHGNGRKTLNRNASLQKQRRAEVKAERAVEKMRKSLIPDKNQKSHFRGLMGSFLRHVQQSRKFKQGKEIPVQMVKSQNNSRNKYLQKPNGFQLPQKHKGVKLPNKAPLNLELGKKTNPKALPKLK